MAAEEGKADAAVSNTDPFIPTNISQPVEVYWLTSVVGGVAKSIPTEEGSVLFPIVEAKWEAR